MTTPRRPSAVTHLPTRAEPVLLTLDEAAALLSVPASWLKQRVARHTVACTRLGRHIRFTHEQLTAIIDAAAQPVLTPPLTGLTRRSRRPA
jgi:excisionase family DNA binding protein